MRLTDLYENQISTKAEVSKFLESIGIGIDAYTIFPDLRVKVDCSVHIGSFLRKNDITQIPIVFDTVDGEFDANSCGLRTLLNFPKVVNDTVTISGNPITSLKHCPISIGFDLYMTRLPQLKSFEYLPKIVEGRIFVSEPMSDDIKNPYEWRYFLYVEDLQEIRCDGNDDYYRKIIYILHKYLHKTDQFHTAIDELMILGESLGFTYD